MPWFEKVIAQIHAEEPKVTPVPNIPQAPAFEARSLKAEVVDMPVPPNCTAVETTEGVVILPEGFVNENSAADSSQE